MHLYQQHGGFNADTTIGTKDVTKISNYQAETKDEAEEYLADAVQYHENLVADGWQLPELHTMAIRDDLRIVQTWERIDGTTLEANPVPTNIAGLVARIMASKQDSYGNIATPADYGLTNFVVQSAGQLVLVDTLPPLIRRSGDFPYDRLRYSTFRTARHVYDEYWRRPAGVITRTAAIGARALAEAQPAVSYPTALREILGAVPIAERRTIQKRLLSFYASTLAFRAARLRTDIVATKAVEPKLTAQ